MTTLDDCDRAILRILQEINRIPHHKIGEAVNLSAPSMQRRTWRKNAEGVISANAARVTSHGVGLHLNIFAELELMSETPDEIVTVRRILLGEPEVQQCFYVAGGVDFRVVFVVESMSAYENFMRQVFFANRVIRKFRVFASMDKPGMALGFRRDSFA